MTKPRPQEIIVITWSDKQFVEVTGENNQSDQLMNQFIKINLTLNRECIIESYRY